VTVSAVSTEQQQQSQFRSIHLYINRKAILPLLCPHVHVTAISYQYDHQATVRDAYASVGIAARF
jgi:hypothetical protein